jgi:hypothetical protein
MLMGEIEIRIQNDMHAMISSMKTEVYLGEKNGIKLTKIK